jgi:hypothetical protein
VRLLDELAADEDAGQRLRALRERGLADDVVRIAARASSPL